MTRRKLLKHPGISTSAILLLVALVAFAGFRLWRTSRSSRDDSVPQARLEHDQKKKETARTTSDVPRQEDTFSPPRAGDVAKTAITPWLYGWKPEDSFRYELQWSIDARAVRPNLKIERVAEIDYRIVENSDTFGGSGPGHKRISTGKGSGSAFAVTSDGLLVTAAHVIDGALSVEANIAGKTHQAKIVAVDWLFDLALLQIDANVTPLPLAGTGDHKLAEEIQVVGFPLSRGASLSVTSGTISRLIGDGAVEALQTDTPINPGNSGGPMINRRGEVVGIVSAKLVREDVSNVGVGAAVGKLRDLLSRIQLEIPVRQGAPTLDGTEVAQAAAPSVAFLSVKVGPGGFDRPPVNQLHCRWRIWEVNPDNKRPGSGGEVSQKVVVIVDDDQAVKQGAWKASKYHPAYHGTGYVHDDRSEKGKKSVTYSPKIPVDGLYEISVSYVPGSERAKAVPITVKIDDTSQRLIVDQTKPHPRGTIFRPIGKFQLRAGRHVTVTISNDSSAERYVMADAVKFHLLPPENETQRGRMLNDGQEVLVLDQAGRLLSGVKQQLQLPALLGPLATFPLDPLPGYGDKSTWRDQRTVSVDMAPDGLPTIAAGIGWQPATHNAFPNASPLWPTGERKSLWKVSDSEQGIVQVNVTRQLNVKAKQPQPEIRLSAQGSREFSLERGLWTKASLQGNVWLGEKTIPFSVRVKLMENSQLPKEFTAPELHEHFRAEIPQKLQSSKAMTRGMGVSELQVRVQTMITKASTDPKEFRRQLAGIQAAIAALKQAKSDPDERVRRRVDWAKIVQATPAKSRTDPNLRSVLEVVSRAAAADLREGDRFDAFSSRNALVDLGPLAQPMLQQLMELAKADDWRAGLAVDVIGHIGPEANPAIPLLVDLAKGESNVPKQANAINALGGIGVPAVPALVKLLRSSSGHVRVCSVQALESIEPLPMDAMTVIAKLTTDDARSDVRRVAAKILGRCDIPQRLPTLVEALSDEQTFVAVAAGESLKSMGVAASAAIPKLREILDGDELMRAEIALQLLQKLDPENAESFIDQLAERAAAMLPDQEGQNSLTRLGPAAAPKVVPLLESKSRNVWNAACSLLITWQDTSKTARDALSDALDHKNEQLQQRVQSNLELKTILQAIEHSRPTVRLAALERLENNPGMARSARPKLEKRLENESPELQAAIQAVLKSLKIDATSPH